MPVICPHCHKEIMPCKNGRPVNISDTKNARMKEKSLATKENRSPENITIRYQRLRCPECLKNFSGGNIQEST